DRGDERAREEGRPRGAGRATAGASSVGDVALAGPCQCVLVPVEVEVLDQACGVQVEDQGAGHGGRHLPDLEGRRAIGDGEGPAHVERAVGGGGTGRGHVFCSAGVRSADMESPRRRASARKRGLLPGSGAATSSCLVKSACGFSITSSAEPRSTTSPRYITRISSEKWRAVARSWVM